MNKRILIFIFAVSIALNTAFVIAWAGVRLSDGLTQEPSQSSQQDDNEKIWCPLHRSLKVTDEQWKQIEPNLLEFQNVSDGVCLEINNKRAEMIELLSKADPDTQAIMDKQKEILAGQDKMQKLVIEHLLFEKSVLTSQQQEEFFRLFRHQRGFGANQNASPASFRQILSGNNETKDK